MVHVHVHVTFVQRRLLFWAVEIFKLNYLTYTNGPLNFCSILVCDTVFQVGKNSVALPGKKVGG